MKLIYLFVEKFKLFSNKEFNFDSNYVCHYDIGTHKFNIVQQSGLESDFWKIGTAPANSSVVESVSAIVGENGSGKTTFAQILLELFRTSPTKQFRGVAVFKIGSELVVHHSMDLQLDSSDIVCHMSDSFPSFYGVKFCYYSPVYTTERDRGLDIWDDGDTCYDLSTTGLLKSYTLDANIRSRDIFTAFDIDEKRRVLEFLSHVEDVRRQTCEQTIQFPIRYPVEVWLEIEELAVQHARDEIARKKERFHSIDKTTQNAVTDAEQGTSMVLDRILKLLEYRPNSDFFIQAFWWYAILHLYDLNLTQFSNLCPAADLELLDFMESIFNSKEAPTKIHKLIFAHLEAHPPKCAHNQQIIDDRIGKTVLRTFRCLHELLDMSDVKVQNGLIILDFTKLHIRQKLLDLVSLHKDSAIFAKFLRFSFPHSISSGEMAFLSMFSRLYECFSNFAISLNAKNGRAEALVLLDEAETALHPSFQRKLVYNAIWFFETFFPTASVHLVFASHSPILLSDIPKSNCEFLVRPDKDGREVPKPPEFNRLANTFGANIFDLYRLSFFMEDGTVGLFASEKIDPILKKLEEAIPRIGGSSELAEGLVQENDFAKIEEIKSLIGDCALRKYIEIALHSIKNIGAYAEMDVLRRN